MKLFTESKEYLTKIMPELVLWYRENRRTMPWREAASPYRTWVSEIMLQQTRVDTVIPYFERFTKELPDLPALAACDEEKLLKLWEGLGYYSRVRNMKKAAILCMEIYEGTLPADYEKLKKLPGIGDYTAGAIASIAFDLRTPVVDGNVLRVLSRILSRDTDIAKDSTKKEYTALLFSVLAESELSPSEFNQSLMELGALICVPNGAPNCDVCPLRAYCKAFLNGRTAELPVKSAKSARKSVDMTVFILGDGDSLMLRKNPEKGLLSALYGLPTAEGFLNPQEAEAFLSFMGIHPLTLSELPEKKHVFTHIDWNMRAYRGFVPKEELLATVGENGYFLADRDALTREIPLATAYKKWNLFDSGAESHSSASCLIESGDLT